MRYKQIIIVFCPVYVILEQPLYMQSHLTSFYPFVSFVRVCMFLDTYINENGYVWGGVILWKLINQSLMSWKGVKGV